MSGTSKRIVCVLCPKGCVLEVMAAGPGGVPEVSGNGCKKGIGYGIQELTEALRTLTTTVRTAFPEFPRLPVRTTSDVPLRRMREYMDLCAGIVVPERLQPGDVVLRSLPGTDAALAATADMTLPYGTE